MLVKAFNHLLDSILEDQWPYCIFSSIAYFLLFCILLFTAVLSLNWIIKLYTLDALSPVADLVKYGQGKYTSEQLFEIYKNWFKK